MFDSHNDEIHHSAVERRLRETGAAVGAECSRPMPAVGAHRSTTEFELAPVSALEPRVRRRVTFRALAAAACLAALIGGTTAVTLGGGHQGSASSTAQAGAPAVEPDSAPASDTVAAKYYYTAEETTDGSGKARAVERRWLPISGTGRTRTVTQAVPNQVESASPVDCTVIGLRDCAAQNGRTTPPMDSTCAPQPGSPCGWEASFYNPTADFVRQLPRDPSAFATIVRHFAERDAANMADLSKTPLKSGTTLNRPVDQLVGSAELWAIHSIFATGAVDDTLAATILKFLPTVSAVKVVPGAHNLAGHAGTGYYVPLNFDNVGETNAALVVDQHGRYIGDATVDPKGAQRASTFRYSTATTLGGAPQI